jgi:hypothetical protein
MFQDGLRHCEPRCITFTHQRLFNCHAIKRKVICIEKTKGRAELSILVGLTSRYFWTKSKLLSRLLQECENLNWTYEDEYRDEQVRERMQHVTILARSLHYYMSIFNS